ncbi:hypothetical protein BDV29DRAFT_98144 [Aspergillus leporis]|jgi:hypothetical protein|uniref:Uncharacterized protein n=1 Tax=Aspergillus leporis TaxID=41062 RepID=A0A5N5X771_9EURO|nr:hypothetical protein BDV29DRAFT_98144 [Aspergillus leporis]
MKSSIATKVPNGHGSVYKEVRFSPTATPIRRTRSVPDAHAAHHPEALVKKMGSSSTLSASYIEQAQSLLVRQRASIDNDRALFAEERSLWEKERELLKLRIAELESVIKSNGIETISTSLSNGSLSKPWVMFNHPFGPRQPTSLSEQSFGAQVWEGSSPGSRPTRVFPEIERSDCHNRHLEQGGALSISATSLDAALSPRAHAADFALASVPVPIEKLDSKLDGITLKSSALPPEVVARVMTPPSPSPQETSPAISEKTLERRNSLKLRLSELGSLERRLTWDAGHTPMVVIDVDEGTEQPSPSERALEEGEPLAPAMPRQPAEYSESYFPNLPDDPALKGPLSLLNDEDHDSGFLKELDQKLLDQAKQVIGYSRESEIQKEAEVEVASRGSQEPELKFKNTTNFGTAFGMSDLGEI